MVLARFLPRDQRFFDYFDQVAANAAEAAAVLFDLVSNYQDVERKVRRLRDLEHRGDEVAHDVFNALNSTFVTPIDREDISDLISRMDDFVDYIEDVGRRLWLYKIEQTTDQAKLVARILSEQANILAEAVPMLENPKQHEEVLRRTVEVNRLENEADDVYNQTMAGLYDGATDIPSLVRAIRWSEIYGMLENASDSAEDVANALEGIILKNA